MRMQGILIMLLAIIFLQFNKDNNIVVVANTPPLEGVIEIKRGQNGSVAIPQSSKNGLANIHNNNNNGKEVLNTYIVHVPLRNKPTSFLSCREWHHTLLGAAATLANTVLQYHGNNAVTDISNRLLYSYSNALQGFAARLTKEEAAALSKMTEVTTLTEDMIYELQTTRTPAFLGLFSAANGYSVVNPGRLFKAANGGRDVIIGLLDSGIWPERRSFANDTGFSPVPTRWKGRCDNVPTFQGLKLCNRKLIGARAFYKGLEANLGGPISDTKEYSRSPRDRGGHGTHTASTSGGNLVPQANLLSYAPGTASGAAPNARLAMYKVCWEGNGCTTVDMLAGFDAAIADGVDMLSLSIGGTDTSYLTAINVGTFAAAEKGIVSIAAAGNEGPGAFTVSNTAPWILTVAASTIDRDFPATVTLGSGTTYNGVSRYSGGRTDIALKIWPVVYGEYCDVPNVSLMSGAVVLCFEGGTTYDQQKGLVVQQAGGVAVVFVRANEDLSGTPGGGAYLMPTVAVGLQAGMAIYRYLSATVNPTVKLGLKPGNTRIGTQEAPSIASFSSRGPNALTWELMKPDVTAPGVGILAAWTGYSSATTLPQDRRKVEFNIIQGTSMATPHVAGIAALLKAAHPTWSQAMIRSAIITTAYTQNNRRKLIVDLGTGNAANPIAMGAGHVNPNAAYDPGLVYDSTMQDYVDFLCSVGYNATMIRVFSRTLTCRGSQSPIRRPGDLNYPSFSVVYFKSQASAGVPKSLTFYRTVTNVSPVKSRYTVSIVAPPKVQVTVQPAVLSFTYLNQKLSYSVTFTPDPSAFNDIDPSTYARIAPASITWGDGANGHLVRSPIMFTWLVNV